MSKYEELAGESKVWVFVANRQLSDAEADAMSAELRRFTDNWQSHGNFLKAYSEIRNNRFLIFAVDEEGDRMCGRAVDASVRLVKEMETRYSASLLDRNLMAFINSAGKVQSCKLSDLNHLLEKGNITPENKVFNNLVSNKNEFERAWLVPLSESWQWRHAAAMIP